MTVLHAQLHTKLSQCCIKSICSWVTIFYEFRLFLRFMLLVENCFFLLFSSVLFSLWYYLISSAVSIECLFVLFAKDNVMWEFDGNIANLKKMTRFTSKHFLTFVPMSTCRGKFSSNSHKIFLFMRHISNKIYKGTHFRSNCNNWAGTQQNLQNDICTTWRLESAQTSVQIPRLVSVFPGCTRHI